MSTSLSSTCPRTSVAGTSPNPKQDLTSEDIKFNAYKGYTSRFRTDQRSDFLPDCEATFEKFDQNPPKSTSGDNLGSLECHGADDFGKYAGIAPPPTGKTRIPGGRMQALLFKLKLWMKRVVHYVADEDN